jgi:hypothetical protein
MVSWRHEGEPHTISIRQTAMFSSRRSGNRVFVRASPRPLLTLGCVLINLRRLVQQESADQVLGSSTPPWAAARTSCSGPGLRRDGRL